jgi:hypothetical protein
VRGLYQTFGRGRLGARIGLVLIVASTVTATVRARPAADPAPDPAAADPIDLAADHVLAWEADGARWVILTGRAAVLQGTEGVRAERAAVKIVPEPGPAPQAQRLEVYAEGRVQTTGRPGKPLPQLRLPMRTEAGVELRPHRADGLVRSDRPPDQSELLRRAFPRPAPATPPAPPETPAATEAPPLVPVSDQDQGPAVALGEPIAMADEDPGPTVPSGSADPVVAPAQFFEEGFTDLPAEEMLAPADADPEDLPAPLAGPEGELPAVIGPPPTPPAEGDEEAEGGPDSPAPILPGSQRVVTFFPRDGGPNAYQLQTLPTAPDGTVTVVITGGVNVVANALARFGTIDISADNAIVWYRRAAGRGRADPGGGQVTQDPDEPMEIYLEGHVVFRQDKRQVAGNSDQVTYRASRFYCDLRTERFFALEAELEQYAPGFVAPLRTEADRILQFRPVMVGPDGKTKLGLAQIQTETAVTTGSRFARPGYRFFSRTVDLFEQPPSPLTVPSSGQKVGRPGDPNASDTIYQIDARQNVFFIGPVPVFYWPRILTTSEDIDPPLRQIGFRVNNYFGQQLLTDWDGFKLFGLKKPKYIDNWNFDIDYLSYRGVALGSEIGYFGGDFSRDILKRDLFPGISGRYFGYLDFWGLKDEGIDNLGGGPAIVTEGPRRYRNGIPIQRNKVPPPVDFRGRILFRHMQSLLGEDADPLEDFRVQVEAAYVSDRNFLEQYYKRLSETGLDQQTNLYVIRQWENQAVTGLVQGNLQNFYTDTQYFPKLDYYRLGDAPLARYFTYFTDTGVDYSNIHTAVEVNNPTVFAFLPFDPVSNTSGVVRTGRAWTSHELDLPIDLDRIRIVPYAQGQLVGWDNQLGGQRLGRAWGALGARANVMAWRAFPGVESELFNIHGLNHKISFDADYRTAYSSLDLDRIAIQDQLDDNTYEYVRRYFALTTFAGGLLPPQYDPRHLTLRRAVSPITGTTDVQDTITTLQLGIHQRLQTRRGPEGRRRVIDYMTYDLTTTYFPNAARDNFGKPFGQNMYNWEWFIGDRTSIVSYGWFEFFDITGTTLFNNPDRKNNPFEFAVITTGVAISRPPRGSIFLGYSIIDTGPISTSALNTAFSYLLSPKWFTSFGTSYDFGNAILLGSSVSITRVGADFLTSVGVSVDPQRQSYQFAFELTPRLSPNIRFGSGGGVARFDTRFAPTQ